MRNPIATPPTSYAGARTLITGGCSGLGLELTRLLAADGARVLVTDRHEQAPEGVLPDGVDYRKLDVRSDDDWAAARTWVEHNVGGLDLLVNNAGVAAGGRIDVIPIEDWQWIIDINLMGVVRGCRTFVPLMKAAKSGHIVNTASLAGLVHAPSMSSYNAVKAAVVAVSETIRHELAPWHIDVSVICPSFFRSDLADSFHGGDPEMEQAGIEMITQAPRSAQDVAAVAYEGMRHRHFIILTDIDGRVAYRGKRFAGPIYTRAMKHAGKSAAEGGSAPAALLGKLPRRHSH